MCNVRNDLCKECILIWLSKSHRGKSTFGHVRPTKTHISMRKREIFDSESSLPTLRNLVIQIQPSEDSICAGLPRGYKTLFMLNSAEHEIFSANKYENANNS